jgi:hypothetical protein
MQRGIMVMALKMDRIATAQVALIPTASEIRKFSTTPYSSTPPPENTRLTLSRVKLEDLIKRLLEK